MTPECRRGCSWDVDVSVFERMENPLLCLGDLDHLIECAAGMPYFCVHRKYS